MTSPVITSAESTGSMGCDLAARAMSSMSDPAPVTLSAINRAMRSWTMSRRSAPTVTTIMPKHRYQVAMVTG